MFNKLVRLGKSNSVEVDLDFFGIFGSRHNFKVIHADVWLSLDEGYQFGVVLGLFGVAAQVHVSLFMKEPSES